MRIETETPMAPSKFNGSFQENGAHTLAERIAKGAQFRCIRYSNQVTEIDCTKAVRTLCRECATGQTIRRKNGLREPSWFAPIDIQTSKSEVEMTEKKKNSTPKIITCPECGRANVAEKARGVCTRCYKYVAAGKPVPPLEDASPANQAGLIQNKPEPVRKVAAEPVKKKATEFFTMDSVIAAAGQAMEAPEQVGPADDYRLENILADPPLVSHDMGGGKTELVIDLNVVVDHGFADSDEVLQIMADFAEVARDNFRTPEAELLIFMRNVTEVFNAQPEGA